MCVSPMLSVNCATIQISMASLLSPCPSHSSTLISFCFLEILNPIPFLFLQPTGPSPFSS
jgi:hypothetical protein